MYITQTKETDRASTLSLSLQSESITTQQIHAPPALPAIGPKNEMISPLFDVELLQSGMVRQVFVETRLFAWILEM